MYKSESSVACLICGDPVACPKSCNIKRNYLNHHKNFDLDYPINSDARKERIAKLVTALVKQQAALRRTLNLEEIDTELKRD